MHRHKRDIDLDKFRQELRGSASDNLITETSFVSHSLLYGEPVQLLMKRSGMFCYTRFKDEFSCGVLNMFWVVWWLSVDSLQVENCSSLIWLTHALAESSVRYWRMKLKCLISMYAASKLHVLMMCCFTERLLSKMKPKLWMIPTKPISVLLRETVCWVLKNKMMTEKDDEKETVSDR